MLQDIITTIINKIEEAEIKAKNENLNGSLLWSGKAEAYRDTLKLIMDNYSKLKDKSIF